MKKKIFTLFLVGGMLLSSVGASASTTSERVNSLRDKLWFNAQTNSYQFYENKKPVTNQLVNYHDSLFYFDENGNAKKGWFNYNNIWYYGSDMMGDLTRNSWIKSGNLWYYLDNDGKMVTSTITIKGKTYSFASDGHLIG